MRQVIPTERLAAGLGRVEHQLRLLLVAVPVGEEWPLARVAVARLGDELVVRLVDRVRAVGPPMPEVEEVAGLAQCGEVVFWNH